MKNFTKLLCFLFITQLSFSQTTEDFETETIGGTTFSDNGQNFVITNGPGESTYNVETFASGGWNGTAPDNRFLDNSGAGWAGAPLNDGTSFTISTSDGADILVNRLYLFLSTRTLQVASSTLTITGKKDGLTVYTIVKSTGFSSPVTFTPNNGFTLIDFSTEGGSDNSNTAVDELFFSTTGNGDYAAVDGINWEAIACTDPAVPTALVATPSSICSGSTSTLTWTGALNDATLWHIYTGSCGGTQVGTSGTNSFTTAALTGNTTFYIRGEDGAGCVDESTGACGQIAVTVNALPTVTFTALADLCLDAGVQAGLGSGTPTGGVYSGPGVTDDGNGNTYSFNPAAAGVGTHTITYNFTDGNGCSGSANDNVVVFGLPTVSFATLGDLCVDAGNQTGLTGGSPAGGVYSGPGVVDDGNGITYSFNPAFSGVGTHTITYNFTDGNGCSGSANDNVVVFAVPTVSFAALADLCLDAGTQTGLTGGSPTGGVYSGPGVTDAGNGTNYSFAPAVAGAGTHTITYIFTDGNGCGGGANDNVVVFGLDNASFSYSAAGYCLGDSDPTPTITGLGGGTFTVLPLGLNINPTTGFINIGLSAPNTYTVTYTTGGTCPNTSNVGVVIGTPPASPSVVSPMTVCPGDDVILSATGSGAGSLIFYNSIPAPLGAVPMPPATGNLNLGALVPAVYSFGVTESNGTCQSLPAAILVTVGDVIAPTAVCQDINVYLDGTGNATIAAGDLDGGATDNCGTVTVTASQTAFTCADVSTGPAPANDFVISGVIDGPLVGGMPKAIELYVINDIADLSQYGVGSANNGGGTDGEEFTFPAVAVTAGTYIYLAIEAAEFTNYFGFAPDYTHNNAPLINGDDAVELFFLSTVIDVFGDINLDGTGQPWEYQDGWAYRNVETGPDGSTFQLGSWSFSGINALDGETTNATAATPIPIGTYTPQMIAGPTAVTLTVNDGNGNSDDCIAQVTVLDTISPTITCPANQVEFATASCDFTLIDYTAMATAADNCATVAVSQSPLVGTVISGTTTITLTATDGSGNTSACTFDVSLNDTISPTMVCQNINVYLDGAGNATIVAADLDGGSTDNCGSITLSASQTVFTCANIGPNNVTLTVTDVSINSANCISVVTVIDTISPVITCPTNQIENVDAACDFTLPDYTTLVTATEACASAGALVWINEIHYDNSGGDANEGVEVAGVAGTDLSGYSIELYNGSNGTIYNTTPFSGIIPDEGAGAGAVMFLIAGLQNGAPDGIALIENPGTVLEFISYEGSFTATNGTANGINSMDIGVTETSSTPIGHSLQLAGSGSGPTDFTWTAPSANSYGVLNPGQTYLAPSNATITQSPIAGTVISTSTTITMTAADGSGNTSTCTFDVSLNDAIAPTAFCQNINVYLDGAGNASIVATDIDGGSTDNCSGVTLSASQTAFTCADLGPVNVTLTVTDGNANSANCVAVVTVIDTISPSAVCQNINAYLDGAGNVTIIAADIDGGSTDNCGVVTLSASTTAFTCADNGPNNVTLTVDDGNGNTATCVAVVTVIDTISPTAVCQNITVFLDGAGTASIVASDIDNGSTDNCTTVTLAADITSFSCADVGPNTVVLMVTDANGNTSTCTSTVTVSDSISPTASCQDITVFLDGTGNLTIADSDLDNGSTDNCTTVTLAASTTAFTCADLGPNSVTLTVTDGSGNTATCTSTVTVADTISPTISCNSGIQNISDDGTGDCTFTPFAVGQAGSYDIADNCSGTLTVVEVFTGALNTTSTFSLAPGVGYTPVQAFPVGVTNVTVTVTDASGNSSSCSYTTTILDDEAPNAVCQNITVFLDGAGNATLVAADIDNGSMDNCSAVTLAASTTAFTCANVGPNSVTLTVTDGSGNTSTCTSTVTVADTISPTITCPADVVVSNDPGICSATGVVLGTPTTADNCSVASVTDNGLVTYPLGVTNVIWTVTDASGNISQCTQTVTVNDTEAPVLPIILDVNVECGVTIPVPVATDNCAGIVAGTTTDPLVYNTQGTYVINWTFDDGNGNVVPYAQNVIVDDVTAPLVVTPLSDVTDECSVTLTAPAIADNCAGLVTGTTTTTFPITVQGTTVVTWTYDDGNGNISSQNQNVIIDDVTLPLVDVAILTDVTAECEVTTLTPPTAMDNCPGALVGTSTVTLPITAQGTTVVTWMYDDGNGNITLQNQNVIITDVTAPVPDVASLATVTGECSALVTAPTATDACGGIAIVGTTTDPVSFTNQGTYTVTWTYTDANGNSDTQTQTVIVDDVTAPVEDVASLADVTGLCSVTLTAPTATDNCTGTITGTTTTVFPVTATTTVTWTYIDGNGNTSTQDQDVIITGVDVTTTTLVGGVEISANNASGDSYQWIDCNNGNAPVGSGTSQNYIATANGSYAVIINENGCIDTSACVTIGSVGIDDIVKENFNIYPNPVVDGIFTVSFEGEIKNIELQDLQGRIINVLHSTSTGQVNVGDLARGKYFVRVTTATDQVLVKSIIIMQ